MKRGRREVVKTRNKSNGDAFGETNKTVDFNSDDDEEYQGSEDEVKRNKLIRLRHSFIANDKATRGQKRQKANSNSDESPVRNSRKRITKTTNGAAPRRSEVNFDASAYFSSDVENADTDNENRENRGGKGKRFRRRLSKKLRDEGRTSTGALNISYGNLNTSVNSPNSNSPTRTPTDTKTLREIYSTCSALFQAHKITPQNAFSLKLVECIDEIIQSEDFDKQNLPLLARTLEIGGKIYVCRVDFSHTHTVKLASEIASNQKSKDDNEEGDHGEGAAQEFIGEEGEEEQDKTKKKTRARNKKKSRYIENDETKLNTKFEDQSSKYVTRRTSLKSKLHRNIDEELEFDYLSFFVKPGEVHPLERDEVSEGLDGPARIPPSHVNEIDMKQLNFLPFNFIGNWSSKKYDIWGQPLDNSEPLDTSIPPSQPETQPEVVDEFAYNPENRPDEYPDPIENGDGINLQDDYQGGDFDMSHHGDDGIHMNGTGRPLSLDSLRSLKDLHLYFSSLKGVQLNMKQKYGWAGPIFLKPQRLELKKRPDGKVKKGRKPKQEMILDYDEVDWKDPSNRYVEGTASKLILDDKMLAKWSETKTSMPFCSSHNFLDYDEDEEEYNEPFETEDCAGADIFNVVRFFVDTNKNIFKLMEEEFKEGKDVLSQSMMREQNTSDRSMEIEAPRDYMDDSVGHDQGEPEPLLPQFQDPYASLLTMLPGSAGFGLDTDDPLSKVSEIDSIKFSKQPKPIDMHELKKVILDVLTIKLQLNEDGKTSLPDDTSTDLLSLICETMKRVSQRMLKHMTISIIVVGLMHVVADKRLFMTPGDHEGNPQIICRGSNWIHKEHIPMGRIVFDF